jgi:hypothetical protein
MQSSGPYKDLIAGDCRHGNEPLRIKHIEFYYSPKRNFTS